MRKLFICLVIALLAAGGWWLWYNQAPLSGMLNQYIGNNDVLTLEARHSPQEIMENHRSELIGDSKRTYQDPSLKFYPYLLLDVKYLTSERKPREGVILWGLEDGEMVLNTDNWEKTHGFQDALDANADRNDFRVINALAAHGGTISRDDLLRELRVEPETADLWIDSTRQKHMVVQQGGGYILHFENPKILVPPQTKISQWLVTKPYSHASRISAKYSKAQIEKIARAAFGPDFTIRSDKEVFLPVYNIEVLNPDGSVLTSYWNALNGQRINPKYMR